MLIQSGARCGRSQPVRRHAKMPARGRRFCISQVFLRVGIFRATLGGAAARRRWGKVRYRRSVAPADGGEPSECAGRSPCRAGLKVRWTAPRPGRGRMCSRRAPTRTGLRRAWGRGEVVFRRAARLLKSSDAEGEEGRRERAGAVGKKLIEPLDSFRFAA